MLSLNNNIEQGAYKPHKNKLSRTHHRYRRQDGKYVKRSSYISIIHPRSFSFQIPFKAGAFANGPLQTSQMSQVSRTTPFEIHESPRHAYIKRARR
jgi:hypothetical protein